jgi:hypothetical protein
VIIKALTGFFPVWLFDWFHGAVSRREAYQLRVADCPANLAASYSTDYMAAYGDEYTISTVPAFTKAADGQKAVDRKDTDTDDPQTQNTLRPVGQIVPKI